MLRAVEAVADLVDVLEELCLDEQYCRI